MEHTTHKFNSLSDQKTLCGMNIKERPEGHYMTLFQLNITCPDCIKIYNEELERIKREET